MVDLPKIPNRTPTSEAPRSTLTRADIEAPFAYAAKALDDIGLTAGAFAEAGAERAGIAAVRTGDDGSLIVDHGPVPLVGKAGDIAKRTAALTYVARIKPQIEEQVTKIRLEMPNDPEGFRQAGQTYIDELAAKVPHPVLQESVRRIASENVAHAYRTALVQADTLNVTNASNAYKSRISDLDNKMAALARQGGVDTPEFQDAQQDLTALYGELQRDARFKFPADRAQSELAGMASRHKGEAIIGTAMRMYDKATPTAAAEARSFLQNEAWHPDLNLSPTERMQIMTRGMASLEGRTAENKVMVDAHKKTVSETIEGLKTSAPYDEGVLNDLIDRSAKLGDPESYYKLAAYKAYQPWRVVLNGASDADRIEALRSIRGGNLVDKIVGAESSGDPDARPPINPLTGQRPSTAAGLGQFRKATWLDLIKRNRPDIASGKSDQEILSLRTTEGARTPDEVDARKRLSREMIGVLADENKQVLTAAGVRADDGALYLAHFLGAGDAVKVLSAPAGTPLRGLVNPDSIAANQKIFARNPTAGDLSAWAAGKAGSNSPQFAWAEAVQREMVNDFTKKIGESIGGMVDTAATALGKGRTLSPSEVQTIAEGIKITGRNDLVPKLEQAMEAYDQSKGLMDKPLSVRSAFRAQLQSLVRSGADPATRAIVDHTEATVKAIEQGMVEKPYATAALRELHPAPGPFQFEQPALVVREAVNRVAEQQVQRNYDGTGPISVFEDAEGKAAAAALTQGDPNAAASMLVGLQQQLPADVLSATMTSQPIRQALTGMISSRDPVRMHAAMSTMDSLWRSDPWGFEQTFGKPALNHLQAWQGLKDSFSPQEVAERLNKADDPSTIEARKGLREEAEKELKPVRASDVAYQLGTSLPITPGFVSRVLGSTPELPYDGLKARELLAQHSAIYTALRSYGIPSEKAGELSIARLKTEWGASPITGGQLMQYPPEKYYAPLDGSHNWMGRELNAYVTSIKGPDVTVYNAGTDQAYGIHHWSIAGLVADQQTQAEVAKGVPPSYLVALNKAGMVEFLSNAQGRPQRIKWDRAPHVAAAEAKFTADRAARETFMRESDAAAFNTPAP